VAETVRARRLTGQEGSQLQPIRARQPGGYRLFVILDNLSANKTRAIRRWAERANVELCFTPADKRFVGPTRSRRDSGRSVPSSSAAQTIPIMLSWPASCRTTCAGAMPTPATLTCWPPSAASEPASAANAATAAAAPLGKAA
jgi:hypothetical protein